MSDDWPGPPTEIVERLRHVAKFRTTFDDVTGAHIAQYPLTTTEADRAADEIERLRDAVWMDGDPHIRWGIGSKNGQGVEAWFCAHCDTELNEPHTSACPWLAEQVRREGESR